MSLDLIVVTKHKKNALYRKLRFRTTQWIQMFIKPRWLKYLIEIKMAFNLKVNFFLNWKSNGEKLH